jgi:hypothetical protein
METQFNLNSSSNASNGGQFLVNFPETFKDFFSMINEDEDHIELASNVLEDKVDESNMRRLIMSDLCTYVSFIIVLLSDSGYT